MARTLVSDPMIIRTDGKTIEVRPCSQAHRDYFEGGYLVMSCTKCKLTRLAGTEER